LNQAFIGAVPINITLIISNLISLIFDIALHISHELGFEFPLSEKCS
jgi:hypothetical protein